MKPEWILVVLGVLLALFSDDLDRLCAGQKELKRVILTFAGGVAAICVILMVVS